MPGRGPSIGRRSPPRASACCAAIAVQSSSARAAGRGDSSSRTSDETRLVLADRTVSVLEAAVGALAVLEEEWAHAAQTAIDADGDYPPEVCNHWLRHWRQLTEMAQGTSNGMIGGSAAPRGRRIVFAVILADLERATDLAFIDRWHWRSVQRIYELQGRRPPHWTGQAQEPPMSACAWWLAMERLAARLGWQGY